MSDKFRILVVDDEEDTRTIVGAFLEEFYEVVYASGGGEALEKLNTHEPDLIVLDALMPDMDGFETCAAIRRHPQFRETMIVFLSCLHENEMVRRMFETGANYYVAKPVNQERLLRNIALSFRGFEAPLPKRFTLAQLRELERRPPQPKTVATPEPEPAPFAEASPRIFAMPSGSESSKAASRDELEAMGPRLTLLTLKKDKSIRPPLLKPLEGLIDIVAMDDSVEAVAWIVQAEPSLIVFDCVPCAEVAAICSGVKTDATLASLSAVMLSAHLSKEVVRQCKRAGLEHLAPRTCQMEQLRKTLTEIAAPVSGRAQSILKRQQEVEQTGYIQTDWRA